MYTDRTRERLQVEWYGHSAFRLTDGESTVVIDPFDDMTPLRERGRRWDYPPIAEVDADLLLITHEHRDHNGVAAVGGDPVTVRSTAGRTSSPIGEVLAVASEHDPVAGTERGPNTLFAFTLGGRRIAHLGDLGQDRLRDEQGEALGTIDLLFVPVGGGPTIGAEQAAAVAAAVGASVIVPMHYRTERIDFLDPVDAFLAGAERVERLTSSVFDVEAQPAGLTPLVVVPATP
jgi:L-ascorbate metabolism protein UlaG (beta-lactamase superfamily)